jgi:hypothetical protein
LFEPKEDETMRRTWAGIALAIVMLAACAEPTGSNAVLPPESPLTGSVVSVDRGEATFVVETSGGEQVAFPIGDQRPETLDELRRSGTAVEVVSELREGQLLVLTVTPTRPD